MSKIQLINGDCLEIMPQLINQGIVVDSIVTDPPYLINYSSRRRKDKTHEYCKPIINDNDKEMIKQTIPLLYSLLKENGALYMFCNSNQVDFFKSELQKYFNFKNILIWIKNNWSAGDTSTTYAKQTEFILFMSKGKQHKLNGGRDSDVLYYDKIVGKKQLHQNQKPVELIEFLIEKSSMENDLILDCFMGSGTTGVACQNLNRDFIGIELDENYFEIAKKRMKTVQSRLI